jgi:hypothetical protein
VSELAHVCQKCDKRQRGCRGPCKCTVSGKDVREHQREGYCPLGLYTKEAIESSKAHQPKPKPYNEWPRFQKWIARRRIDGELNTAETARRLAAKVGGERFKRIAKRFGVDCGCDKRYARWSIEYPYTMLIDK